MTEKIGTVISTPEGPSASEFSFVIDEDSGEIPVRQNQFVMLGSEEGKLIARVSDIYKTNRYFDRAESVREYERKGKKLTEIFPAERWEYLVGEAKPLGVYADGRIKRATFPPSPGTEISMIDESILADFLGMDEENGLHIGSVGHHDVPVKLSMTKLLQKHLAILALSGAGKSYLTSVIIEELLDRDGEAGQIGTVVVDTHGEYIGFGDDENYRDRVKVIRGKDFKIGASNLTPSLFFHFKPNLSGAQRREMGRILREMRKDKTGQTYSLSDIADRVAQDDSVKSSTKEVLLSEISQLERTGLFGVSDNPSMDDLVNSGETAIVDVSDFTSLEARQMLVTYLGRKLFFKRQDGEIPPFLLVLEEAHNFAPEGKKRQNALSRSIIQRIAREGRKFHSSLCLVSQRPIKLDTTALSQCNTNVIMRITNPYDQDHIGKSSEGLTRDVLDTISSLRVGEAFIVGEAVNYPLFAQIRERKSVESERGMPLEKAAKKYSEEKEERKEDAESFM
ncbi:MAG: ATP-binding protein [Candidatus Aenigmatarchaeota archaeon]